MNSEIKNCQNCKTPFTIEPEDFQFYEKIKVPAPTWCPECRLTQREMFRNERALYKQTCELCKKSIITMYAPEKPYLVYCTECHQSDKWDPLSYGREYDFSKPFFEQYAELMRVVPRRALYVDFAENSEYANWGVYLKNCYLVFGGHHDEDCLYVAQGIQVIDCVDIDFTHKSEQCYASINLKQCNKTHFSQHAESCVDSWFLLDCRNCSNCIGCANLRNTSYCIFNQQYTKEEYARRAAALRLHTYSGLQATARKFADIALQHPRRFMRSKNAEHSTGDDLDHVKNCIRCFFVAESENTKYSFFIPSEVKDSHDLSYVGLGAELAYQHMSGFGLNRVVCNTRVYFSHDVYYSDDCYNSSELFGCIGLKKKQYCILNKQYTKEGYENLIPRIIAHMNESSYAGQWDRVYRFGDFFPAEISPFAYNESTAQKFFPLTKERALERGYAWRDPDPRNYSITILPTELPDSVADVSDDILELIISCAHAGICNDQCTTAFKIIPQELQFYRKMNLPLPRLCPNCRHYQRLKQRNPLKLWHRACQCAGRKSEIRSAKSETFEYENTATHFHGSNHCPNEFETSYAPERPEIVYCEECYRQEVV